MENNFRFSPHGIESKELFCKFYADFIEWCKSVVSEGCFSTYMNGEPVCFSRGLELSYRVYLANK